MIIKEPKTPLPAGYVPTGGVPYRVGDSDGWFSIAGKCGVDVWWLIQYNFETRNPAEVNWYLKHRTGCNKTTADGKNFKFSTSATPGIVYIPSPQAARPLKSLKYSLYGIVINGDGDYQREVELTLGRLARSDTGMVLLNAIQATGKEIAISPWTGASCNATATVRNTRDGTAAGEVILRGTGSFEPLKEPDLLREFLDLPLDPMLGTGAGSAVDVNFSPTNFGYGVKGLCSPFAGSPGASPSQVLFHELAHAYRYAAGKFNRRPTVGGSTGYTDMEEFFAVVLSNILTSDPTYSTGNRTLRADHSGFLGLAPALSTSRAFASNVPNRNKLRELVASEPVLVAALRGVTSSFNPFIEPL